jgi:hypothetical protein
VKGEVKATECHMCKENGESIQIYGGHNFRDPKGRIVCSNFLKKNRTSGFDVIQKLGKFICNMNKKNEEKPTVEPNKEVIDDSSDDEFEKLYPYITIRSKLALQMPEPWCDSDDE